ncbi:hypothetical protein CRG98_017310 [Punica granatum]|uniref:Uncharacterized protein n=1 Tax=Punica granatum TaxID=22663 RepID=A0A2I0K169_PUNGR|nr:hypothetical protein CRG98_017310 [Punica granatum]
MSFIRVRVDVLRARKSILLDLDDRSEVDCFYHLFASLRAILLAMACFVLWAEQLTRRPEPEIGNWRRPGNLRLEFSQKGPVFLGLDPLEECSLVLVTIGCGQACFRMPLIHLRDGSPGRPIRRPSADVRECPSSGG